MSTQIAKEILKQLGGSRFHAMIGTSNISSDGDNVTLRFKGCKKANCLRVTLNNQDLYDIEFINIKKYDCIDVKKFNNVYNDMLTETFEKYTGLYTSL